MRYYLAARYSRAPQMRDVAQQLATLGHTCTARWIHGGHELTKEGSAQASDDARQRFALEDWTDLAAADVVISFTEEPRTTTTRGGRHVEFGAALALGQLCLVVGPRENVFHHLPQVLAFDTRELAETWIRARFV